MAAVLRLSFLFLSAVSTTAAPSQARTAFTIAIALGGFSAMSRYTRERRRQTRTAFTVVSILLVAVAFFISGLSRQLYSMYLALFS